MTDENTSKSAIELAIEAAGSMSKLARKLHLKPQLVRYWKFRGYVPLRRIKAVAEATGVSEQHMLSDLIELAKVEPIDID